MADEEARDLDEVPRREPHAGAAEEGLTSSFDFLRFLDLMRKHMKLRDAFRVLNKDIIGSVSDLHDAHTSIGEKLEPSEFDEWIREVDVGPDGTIKYKDFIVRMVAK
ncbi:putative calcium-binding protein CML7 [Acorus calamus]|uniref:Calcium-binding protein CML7 n=1 Tax=Acorus calamus TaxID=4465 RepID=A0AAV9EYL1_ACOCL|nr:putative calcium-binding protein CML7 [Acorus calamus]